MPELTLKPTLSYAIQYFDETGAMRAPYLICRGFLAAGWNVEIITTASEKNRTIEFAWGTVPVRKISGPGKKIKLIKLALILLKQRRNHIVMTTVWDWHNLGLALAKIFFKSPYVLRLDTYAYKSSPNFWGCLKEMFRYRWGIKNASIILAETPFSFAHTRQFFRGPDVLQVPSCLWLADLKAIEARWTAAGYHPRREHIIFFAGRIVERKNIHHLLQAFARLKDAFPDWRVEIRGPIVSSSYYDQLQQIIEDNGLNNRVHLLPALSGEWLYHRYRETAIYALPSEQEGLPTTIYEAMYFGGAIVAGISGGVDYQLENGECGLLHSPGDVDTLTAHLNTLMASPATRNRYMTKARARVKLMFMWERYFPDLEKKFRALAAQG